MGAKGDMEIERLLRPVHGVRRRGRRREHPLRARPHGRPDHLQPHEREPLQHEGPPREGLDPCQDEAGEGAGQPWRRRRASCGT